MAVGSFFARLFGMNDSEQENQTETSSGADTVESSGTTLQDAVNFIVELQSYYYNDICKMQSDLLVQTALTNNEIHFINKKIKQDQTALNQIDEILNLVKQEEREYQTVWKKSVYSFYDEIEKAKLEKVQSKVFTIMLKLCEVNTKPELDNIILNRLESYRVNWNIDNQIQIPKNYNAILVEENDGIEKYRIGDWVKNVYPAENDYTLTNSQLDKIRALEIEFEDEIPTDTVWVYVSSVTRLQLNHMRKSCIIKNDWEHLPEETDILCFDVINVKDLEYYLKGILQILLTRRTYAVISIVIPTTDMLRAIGPVKQNGEKIEICKKYRFCLKERSGLYKDNLITARIDRRNIPEKLQFMSYLKFRKLYF